MKSRSHRLPAHDPPDDWVNGSWTVDCVCGVNFDDGEEMVNCDECGVWVHTRCSRYVRSEKSFACDKCKSKSSRNNSEETEVAQLLVELPTKTMKMSHSNRSPLNNPVPHRPYRLWTERPMEERVHVQGVPGGDPTLFKGLSSIFTAELWKCSGYVPKKFNFQYKEFPCWDGQKKVDEKAIEDSENMVDNGAGVLYSLSKDSLAMIPDSAPERVRSQEFAGSSAKKLLKGKSLESLDANNKGMQNIAKKERSLTRPFVIHSGKRKREDTMTLDQRTGKKKSKEHDIRRNKFILKTAVGPMSSGRNTESVANKALNASNTSVKDTMHGHADEALAPSNVHAAACNGGRPRSSSTPYQKILGGLSPEAPEHNRVTDSGVNLEKDKNHTSGHVTSHEIDDAPPSAAGQKDVIIPTRKEALSLNNVENNLQPSALTDALDPMKREAPVEDINSTLVQESSDPRQLGDSVLSSVHPGSRTAGDASAINSKCILKTTSTDHDIKMEGAEDLADSARNPVLSSNHISESFEANDAVDKPSHSGDHKFDTNKGEGAPRHYPFGKLDDVPETSSQLQQELLKSDSSMGTEKVSSESKRATKATEEASKLDNIALSPPISSSQHKSASGVKFVSCSSNVTVPRSFSIDKHKSPSSHQPNSVIKRALSNSVSHTKKDRLNTGPSRDEDKHEQLRTAPKERPKSSTNSTSKASNPIKPDSSSLKQTSTEAKDFVKHPSSKTCPAEKTSFTSRSGETNSSSKAQGITDSQNRNAASSVQSKGEKGVQSNSVSTPKGNHSSAGHAAASSTPPAGLSDEELALLLHQELNSSPRVPRIPRMRQAGSVPHLSSGVATNIYTKRTSSSGNKDQHTFSRRKSKDVRKDGPRSSRGFEGEAKKADRVPSSPDSSKTADTSNLPESSAEALDSARKNAPQSSATAASNVASSSADHTEQNSPHTNCDDDAGTGGPVHRTLPCLIADIMSKGERMTYEELCNAVLPHWQNLRKHNGERYAYSSPSQAVLDCLRNRAEWAQLVDRGPKTNGNRKRRKHDSEGQNTESEDNGYSEGRVSKRGGAKNADPSREEFPKGKRNARKRRRLALQGRNIKDVRKRRKTKVVSDDESSSFSDSSKESPYSEGESQDDAAVDAGGENSASSDETGSAL